MRGRYLGPYLTFFGLNIQGKFEGHSSRASYICQVRDCGILGISDYLLGGLQPPALVLGPISLQRLIQRNMFYECGKFRFSGPFSFRDMKAQILHFLQWQHPHRSCGLRSLDQKIVAAVMRYFDVL